VHRGARLPTAASGGASRLHDAARARAPRLLRGETHKGWQTQEAAFRDTSWLPWPQTWQRGPFWHRPPFRDGRGALAQLLVRCPGVR
jgi:hypothetical protein